MKSIRSFAVCMSVALLAGCGMHSANLRVGTQQSLASLADQRAAQLTVAIYPSVPEGGVVVGPVDAARCHRFSNQSPPTDADVTSDLKIAAYAKGANGLTDVRITKKSGLTSDCWHILNGTATAITVPSAR